MKKNLRSSLALSSRRCTSSSSEDEISSNHLSQSHFSSSLPPSSVLIPILSHSSFHIKSGASACLKPSRFGTQPLSLSLRSPPFKKSSSSPSGLRERRGWWSSAQPRNWNGIQVLCRRGRRLTLSPLSPIRMRTSKEALT